MICSAVKSLSTIDTSFNDRCSGSWIVFADKSHVCKPRFNIDNRQELLVLSLMIPSPISKNDCIPSVFLTRCVCYKLGRFLDYSFLVFYSWVACTKDKCSKHQLRSNQHVPLSVQLFESFPIGEYSVSNAHYCCWIISTHLYSASSGTSNKLLARLSLSTVHKYRRVVATTGIVTSSSSVASRIIIHHWGVGQKHRRSRSR